MPRTTFATTKPTKNTKPAITMFGKNAKVLSIMLVSGVNKPSRPRRPTTMVSTTSKMNQYTTSAIVPLIGFTPASFASFSSKVVLPRAAVVAVRATVAITQPITPTATAAKRFGRNDKTWLIMLANGTEIESRRSWFSAPERPMANTNQKTILASKSLRL
ncbi:Uncharacterised protein [Moraxella caviae]|nr:Uncharacterised protein [Moraxella caviae]